MPQPATRVVTIPKPAGSMFVVVDGASSKLVGMHPQSKTALLEGILGRFFPEKEIPTDMVGDGFQPNVEEMLRVNPDIIFQWGMSEDMVLYPDNFDWPLRSFLAEKYQEIYDHGPLTCGAAPADVARPASRRRRRASASPDDA